MRVSAQRVGISFAAISWGKSFVQVKVSPDMSDPFKLFFRLMLAFFKIAGYSLACGAQSLWYLAHGKPELVGDAIGYFGRDVTNAIADIFGKG
jgi:hypothetical protein